MFHGLPGARSIPKNIGRFSKVSLEQIKISYSQGIAQQRMMIEPAIWLINPFPRRFPTRTMQEH
jgi:hypothetical protein